MYAGGYLHDPRDVKLAAEKQTVVMPVTQLRHLKQHSCTSDRFHTGMVCFAPL